MIVTVKSAVASLKDSDSENTNRRSLTSFGMTNVTFVGFVNPLLTHTRPTGYEPEGREFSAAADLRAHHFSLVFELDRIPVYPRFTNSRQILQCFAAFVGH
jgi:hypothetical protein